jgi:hypothetical protein
MLFGEYREQLQAKEGSTIGSINNYLRGLNSTTLARSADVEQRITQIIADHFRWIRNDASSLERDVLSTMGNKSQ